MHDILKGLGLENPAPGISVASGQTLFAPGQEADDQTNSQSFALASGTQLDVRLGFRVGSVVIDNNTSAYINVPDATRDGTGRFVPPGQGAAMPILGHISRARINWIAPTGKNQPPIVAGETAQVVFFASPLPLGFGIAAPVTQPWQGPTTPLTIDVALAANGTSILIPGITGRRIYLFEFAGTIDAVVAAGWFKFRDTTGSSDFGPEFGTSILGPHRFNFAGIAMSSGSALGILNSAAGAINMRGGLLYTQI